jgi:Spy/CpxP family protein refolding chaperone
MKKISLITIGALLLVGSSLFAQPQGNNSYQEGNNCFNNGNCQYGYKMHKGKARMHKGYMNNGHNSYVRNGEGFMFFNNLNLTPEQRHNMSIIKDEMRLEMKKTFKPKHFSNNKFDKNLYVKNTKEQKEILSKSVE